MGVAEKVKAKATAYFGEQPELAGESPSSFLVDFAIEKYKDIMNYPKHFTDAQIEEDIEKHISTIAAAVVDLKMKEGAEGETSHSENSTSRTYENAYISKSIFRGIYPYVDTF
nr:MAG TPA: hypothetical protein [Caudoviricetes sp.]